MRRELAQGELSALTTRDLDAINHYLSERAKARQSSRQQVANRVRERVLRDEKNETLKDEVLKDEVLKDKVLKDKVLKDRVPATGGQRTYTEQEILAEFGLD